MILIDGWNYFAGKDMSAAESTQDQLDFENKRSYIGEDIDGDIYVFTQDDIHSEGLNEDEANEECEKDEELTKIINIIK